jgi:hypothetical protein
MEVLVLLRHRILGAAISLALLLVLGTSAQAQGGSGIALVQDTNEDAGMTTSATLAFNSNTTAGNWIGICIRAGAGNETFTVTDSNGNTYHQAIQFNGTGNDNTFGIFYAENIAGGPNTIKVSDTAWATLRFTILEYSGVATSGSLDVAAAAEGDSASPNSGNVVTTARGDLLLGVTVTANPATFTAVSSYAIEQSVPAEPKTKLIAEDQIQTTAGTASASATLGAADVWGAELAAFKAAAAATTAARPTISPASGSYTSPRTVTMSCSTPGSTIYYTTNGTTPTSGSTFYKTGFSQTIPATLEAICEASGYTNSAVATNVYTSPGPWTHVMGSATIGNSVNGTTCTATLPSNPPTGSTVKFGLVAWNSGGPTPTLTSIQDANGNSYMLTPGSPSNTQYATSGEAWIGYILSAPPNALAAITATFSSSIYHANCFADVAQVASGYTPVFDGDTAGSGTTGTAINTPSFTPATSQEDVYVVGINTNFISAAGSPWATNAPIYPASGYSTMGAATGWVENQTSTVNPNMTGNSSGAWDTIIAAFKAAASGSVGGSGSSPSGNQGGLSASTLTVNFGNVNIGSSGSRTITLTDSGTANVTVSNVSLFGPGIEASGVYVGLVLTPGQTATLNVTFAPAATGSTSGSITVASNAANSLMSIAVSGAGVQPVSHSVDLVWTATTGVVGYNVYRGSASGGPYTTLTNAPIATTSFTDTNVQSGQTYYYAVTSLNSAGGQSTFSNPASATIP